MTDVFNIDLETEGFRRNNLDWRKFREKYNKISASKLERGIKPLPIPLLLRLFGPQKVLNTFVVTRRSTAELDYCTTGSNVEHNTVDMKANDNEKAVAKKLNFPGEGILISSSSEEMKPVLRKSTVKKLEGLPVRPVFQRNLHVPGRYFPKPSSMEDGMNLTLSYTEGTNERPRTQTPYTAGGTTPCDMPQNRAPRSNGFKGKSAVLSKNSKVIRGSVCKATDTLSSYSSRALSGKSTTTVKSMPAMGFNEYSHLKHDAFTLDRKLEIFPNSVYNEGYDIGMGFARHDRNVDTPSDIYSVKRLRLNERQVTFPRSSHDFSTVLQGRPKTLHRRELTETVEQREPRARTHVGFAESEMT